jgi:gluconokinase
MWPRGFLIMGVSGSGKSTLGKSLAQVLDWDFFDADDFHSRENISKMADGIALTDADRAPWLAALNRQLATSLESDRRLIMACSALKEKYRRRLLEGVEDMTILYLKGDYETIRSRLLAREEHYMKENLLQSQFEALEEPRDALVLDIAMSVEKMLETILINYPSIISR